MGTALNHLPDRTWPEPLHRKLSGISLSLFKSGQAAGSSTLNLLPTEKGLAGSGRGCCGGLGPSSSWHGRQPGAFRLSIETALQIL